MAAVRIQSLAAKPVRLLRYFNATRQGRPEPVLLPFLEGEVSGLPEGLDALVATSDLQGVVPARRPGTPAELVGVRVAEEVAAMLPRRARVGVLLAGDLFSDPEARQRGGFGDVAPVWAAFAARFAWVVGVAGNHDDASTVPRLPDVHLLDGDEVELKGLRVGGVGLVAGDPRRPGRRDEEEQLARLELVAETKPDLLVVHEGPEGGPGQPGSKPFAEMLLRHPVGLTVSGHVPWEQPLGALGDAQLLCVHQRVVVLHRAAPSAH